MTEEFKPSREVFLLKILWLAWPLAFLLIGEARGFWPEPPVLLETVVFVGTYLAIGRAARLNKKTLKISSVGMVITDGLFGKENSYEWRLVQHPCLEETKWPLFRPRLIFSFRYHEGGEVQYWLSELSDKDRDRAVKTLKRYLPEVQDVDFTNFTHLTPRF